MSIPGREKNQKSKDFRYIYANGIVTQFGGNDVTLIFGIKENQSALDNSMNEEVGVIMTPTTAKMLAISLTKLIEGFEKQSKSMIPVNPELSEALDQAVKQAHQKASALPPEKKT